MLIWYIVFVVRVLNHNFFFGDMYSLVQDLGQRHRSSLPTDDFSIIKFLRLNL